MEAAEREMAERLGAVLDQRVERCAIVGRVGSDLSLLRFESDRPVYTHLGFALRDDEGWSIHHLLNTHGGAWGHLYRQPLIDFFRDDPFDYRAAVLVPARTLQHRMADVLASALPHTLHTARYSAVAYPFAARYQNSNQWVLELAAAAQGGGTSRRAVQAYLRERGFRPTVLRTVGLAGQLLYALRCRNTRFDDHPLRDRLAGRIAVVLEPAVRRWLDRSDALVAESTVRLGPQAAGGSTPPGSPSSA